MFVHGNVDASADQKIKGIVARGLTSDNAAKFGAAFVKISIKIAVGSAEQGLNERFEMRSTELYDWTYVVSEQIALNRYGARTAGAIRWVSDGKVVGIASVALKLTLDSDVLAEVKST